MDVLISYIFLFGILHLALCNFAMDCSDLRRSVMETLAMIDKPSGKKA
jgi:hypothetical protein